MSFEAYETSSAQKRLYMINHLLGDSILYNEFRVWIIEGNLEPSRLKNAVAQTSRRHESLRTCFVMKDGEVLQKVYDHIECDFKYSRKQLPPGAVEETVENFLTPYDLAKAPLWKIELVQAGPKQQLLLFDFHHIIADGTSMDVIIRELTALYLGKELPEPEVQYVDFAIWQNDMLKDGRIKKQEAYWLEVFEGEVPVLELPTDYPRSLEADTSGSSIEFEMEKSLAARLNHLALQHNTTLYVVLLAGLNILLSSYSSQEDIVVGTPIAGRTHREFENIVGMFVNTLAMRNKPTADKTFEEFLAGVSQNTFAAFENQDYQFEMLVENVAPERHLNRNPLFDVMFALQNYSRDIRVSDPGSDTLTLIPYHYKNKVSKFDLSLQAFENEGRIVFLLEYRTALFRKDTVETLTEHFINIFREVVENCDLRLSDIRVLSEAEKEYLLFELNDTVGDYPADKTLHQLFDQQVEKDADSIALIGPKLQTTPYNRIFITYRELNKEAGELAYRLKEKGVQPGTLVGIMVERSIEMIIGILGILKSGNAYLPIDPGYPEERVNYILKDSRASMLLEIVNCQLSIIDCQREPRHSPAASVTTKSPAYVIYTSGSTGKPKGVIVEHQNAVRLVKSSNFIDFTKGDKLLLTGAIVFDITTFEIWAPLLNGSTLVLAHQEVILDAEKLETIIYDHKISVLHLIPQLFNQLADRNPGIFNGLKYFLVGGDVVSPHYINRIRKRYKDLKILHMYGPTENTTFSTYFLVDKEYEAAIPIGKPVSNSTVYIMDKDGGLKPPGAVGEICVGGAGVARGYLNQPELTKEKFCLRRAGALFEKTAPAPRKNVLLKICSHMSNIYRTGDLGRWLPNGNIEFSGRLDTQVKIRGFRIELGEIENRLLEHPSVKEAVLVAGSDETGDRYLCAYIASQEEIDIPGIRSHLSGALPDYMIPGYFVRLDRFPLTPGGKVDRNALPRPGIKAGDRYIAPRDGMERKLAEIWSEVLNIDKNIIGINSNFFELGGHSLKAAILTSKIHKAFNVKVPLAQFFKLSDIRGLSGYIREAAPGKYASIAPVEKKEYYELSSAQKRLYFLYQLDPESTGYNIPVSIPLKGVVHKESLERAFQKLIERHENLRTSFEMTAGGPVQKVHPSVEFTVTAYDFSNEKNGTTAGEVIDNFSMPFDLSRVPLYRAALLKTANEQYLMLIDIHHIVADGTSVEVLKEDFAVFYAGDRPAPLYFQYKDFSTWQNAWFESGKIKQQEDYWLHLYAGEIPKLNLPLDYPRPGNFTFKGETYWFKLDREQASQFNALSRDNNATLYMNMLTAFNVLLHRYTGQCDIIVGSGIAGRPHADLQGIIGMFVNMLAMRCYPVPDKKYNQFLNEVRDHSLNAYENQDVQFEELVDKLGLERDPSRNPLFDVTMVVQNIGSKKPPTENEAPDTDLTPYKREMTTSKFDMTLFIYEIGDEIYFNLEYYTGIFERESMEGLARHFLNIIRQVNDNAEIKIAGIDILSEEEKQELLFNFNNAQTSCPPGKTIHQLYEEQAGKNPDAIALVYEDESVSYGRLDEAADGLANYLLFGQGLQPGEPAAVLMDKCIAQVISLLGVLKAGGAYLPLDPSIPGVRIKNMLDDSALRIVISLKKHIRVLNRLQWECKSFNTFLCMDSTGVYREDEEEMCGLMDEKLWDYVAESAVDEITGGGWLTGYTGAPFSKEEMDEYGDNALEKLIPLLHDKMRVLEIGCASGITMYRVAPRVGYYYGTDLSEKVIQKNKQRIHEEGHNNIILSCLPAHEIEKINEKNFDLIIINSVIQSFHGHNYLRKVIARAVDLLSHKGYLFIGDVMDQDLKEDLTREMIEFKKANRDNGSIKTKTDWSAELFVSRLFFEDLRIEIPEICSVEFSDKICTLENELTKFRYDALMTIDKTGKENKKGLFKHKYQHDLCSLETFPAERVETATKPGDPAYIIFTSGSTGKPKGVMVEHKSVIRLVKHVNYIDFSKGDRLLLTGSIAFDITTFEIWGPLLNGLSLYLADRDTLLDAEKLKACVLKNNISILHLIPKLFDQMAGQCLEMFARLKYFLIGGDLVQPGPVNRLRKMYPHIKIIHCYGPTENTTFSTALPVDKDYDERIPIGKPIADSRVYILDRSFLLQPRGVAGELCLGGAGLARGYLNRPELTAEKFRIPVSQQTNYKHMSYLSYMSHIYKTGDLARWLSGGNIEFLGRIDQQVKIRGFRIEPVEIENQLLQHEEVREAVVIARDDKQGDKYLCAYVVGMVNKGTELREYLSRRLPDYMIPSYFMPVEKIPLTSNGKIDKKALPHPEIKIDEGYRAPTNKREEKLTGIWSEILGIEKGIIGIDSDFFQLGGHSLKATLFVSRAHKELNVKIPLAEVFKNTTIRELAGYIEKSGAADYISIVPVEKRDFYPLSSAQKRLFFLQQLKPDSTAYNMPDIYTLETDIHKEKLEKALNRLIARHESLRTSFHMVNDEPVQRIYEEDYYLKITNHKGPVEDFIRPFDLAKAPLIRAGWTETGQNKNILLIDIHHIVSDGTSHTILVEDIMALYGETEPQPLRIQYKDFSQWQNRLFESGEIEKQQQYWLDLYRDAGEIPRVQIPTDFKRPEIFTFAGDNYDFMLEKEDASQFRALSVRSGATLYMNLLAVLDVLFYKYTGQTDIIIGSGIAGRPHADLQQIIGMFVNTLAVRNYPQGEKTYGSFLEEVVSNSVNAFDNQDVQFEELVDKLAVNRDSSRNPLFDISMVVQNFRGIGEGSPANANPGQYEMRHSPDENATSMELKYNTAKFDLTFFVHEWGEDVYIRIEYYSGIFAESTIRRMTSHFNNVVKAVIHNPSVKLKDIEIISPEEKKQVLYQFNDTAFAYPKDKAIHEFFEEQAAKTPDRIAAVKKVCVSYKELNAISNRLANYLYLEKHIREDDRLGMLMDRSIDLIAAILGILKSGGAYVPIDPSLPEERMAYMIDEASIGVVISEKKYLRSLNRLQWQCRGFHSYLCMDSMDIHGEDEVEKSELMDEELWHYVGETAEDEITGGGWVSSYTGEPFSREEMDEYGGNIFKKLEPLLHNKMRVLEIGTASGISMYRIAPRVGLYYGTDLSGVIIEKNKKRVEREGYQNIKLACLAAHEIDKIEEKNFDLIIMNSVIQSFHGHNYLRKAIHRSIGLLAEKGYLFIGDVMDREKQDALVREMVAFKYAHRNKEDAFTTKTDFSAELFVARGFWEDLEAELPEIESVAFSDKIYTIENELTKFRYDALVTVNKKTSPVKSERKRKQKYQEDRSHLIPFSGEKRYAGTAIPPDRLAYIIYTSGTTGNPKGVMIGHHSVVNLALWQKSYFGIDENERILQFSSVSFDASVEQIWLAFFTGAGLVLVDKETLLDNDAFEKYIYDRCVTHLHAVPSYLHTLEIADKSRLKRVIAGGDTCPPSLAQKWYKECKFYNEYGPTETTVTSMEYPVEDINRHQGASSLSIGSPLGNTTVYILDNNRKICPPGIMGELYIGGDGLARGYLNNPELTKEKFLVLTAKTREETRRKKNKGSSLLYNTGDLARWLPDGTVEFAGRIDHQVKIRGFRIECEEIQTRLLKHVLIKEAIIIDKEGPGDDKYLCAYIVPSAARGSSGDILPDTGELRNYLSASLPDYMIPAYFKVLDSIPLTPSGKPDRKALPEPGAAGGEAYAGPRDGTEKKLVEIWSEILGEHSPIGIDDNFFELGGHSLKATILTSRIHKEMDVKIPLVEIFKNPTIRRLSGYFPKLRTDKYTAVEPVEKRDFYPLSSAQKRLFFLQQLKPDSTAYNMPDICPLETDIHKEKLERALKRLIARHESLRTSFHVVDDEPVQRVLEENYNFQITNHKDPVEDFIKPFDLTKAPLMRAGWAETGQNKHILLIDIHHIVSDGTSHTILVEDMIALYEETEPQSLRIQYKDFSQWQNRLFESGEIEKQQQYWLDLYWDSEKIPRVQLPTDFKRPEIFTFTGGKYDFMLEKEDASQFRALSVRSGATLYMNILAVLDVLFYKYTGQTDIIIGSGIAGRPHADLQQIIGMFVNTLAVRNYPQGEKTYGSFLEEVVSNSINAFDNQDVQFEELVDKLAINRDTSRNPLFDISMVVQNFRGIGEGSPANENPGQYEVRHSPDEDLASIELKYNTAKFDLTFFVHEWGEDIYIRIEYYSGIFAESTIRRTISHFNNVVKAVIHDPSLKLKDIEIISPEEKKQVLYQFNDTAFAYPKDKAIHEFFEEQAAKTPDRIAAVKKAFVSYKELNEISNRLANYLYLEKHTRTDDRLGILMDRSIGLIAAILGILKSGGAYVPIDPSLPEERMAYMIDDASIGVVISEKKYLRSLNRLQWQCRDFHSYLCMDSMDIHGEDEVEKSELMDEELWHYVGETAEDEITGGGWVSSYTGELFSREEMDEYGDNIFKKLEPLLHDKMRVLEIGTASGISMYRIAPRVGLYYGTDLSGIIIEKNKERVEREGHRNIKLACLAAHEIDKIDEKNFDLIIMNSVIQNFHGHNYLRKAIHLSIGLLAEKGYLFIGDVMDQEKRDALERELTEFKYTHWDKDEAHTTKTDFSTELFVARGFWEDLEVELPEIESVAFSDKIYTIENELTKFRYDALVTVNKKTSVVKSKRKRKQKYQEDRRHLIPFSGEKRYAGTAIPPDRLAYIIYTSGTTGNPKGVMIGHHSVVNLVLWQKSFFGVAENERILQFSSVSFDASVEQIWLAFFTGSGLVLVDKETLLDNDVFEKYIYDRCVTHLHAVPSFLQTLEIEDKSRLKRVISGGDTCPKSLAQNWYKECKFYNKYGPTETTVTSIEYSLEDINQHRGVSSLSIGCPLGNTTVYILDNDRKICPPGIMGELYIGGDGLARGYLNNPELTKEKFLVLTAKTREETRRKKNKGPSLLYKTGDLARWLPDGTVEFAGRIDHQVKIRGFRIECGEIQTRLLKHESIKEAIIIDKEGPGDDKYLCAYIVPSTARDSSGDILPDTGELRNYLSASLPDYMIPAYFQVVDSIPLTPNGKLDRKALPEPGAVSGEEYIGPRDDIEKKLVEIWSEILGVLSPIGIDDNFFELGGHSLKATILTSRIHKKMDVKIPLALIFKTPSVRGMSDYIKETVKEKYVPINAVEKKEFYPLSSAQKRLYVLQQMDPASCVYNMPAIGFREEIANPEKLEKAFTRLINRHESLRTSFHMVDDEPVQRVHAGNYQLKIAYHKGPVEDFIRPFDLTTAPLMRVALIETGNSKSTLVVDIHHIVTDGLSQDILIRDFLSLYNDESLPPLRIRYRDFAVWQNSRGQREIMEKQERYWLKELEGPIPLLDMPTDFERSGELGFEGSTVFFTIDASLTGKIKERVSQWEVTLLMFLAAVYKTLLSRYTGQEEIIIGTIIAGRRHADLENLIGFFVNMLVLRTRPGCAATFGEFLKEIKEKALQAYENQEYQFEELVSKLQIPREPGRQPLIDTVFTVLNSEDMPGTKAGVPEAQETEEDSNPSYLRNSRFDLTFFGTVLPDCIRMQVEYSTSLFKKETIEELSKYYVEILEQVVENMDIPLREIKIAHELVVLQSNAFQEDHDEWVL